MRLMMASSVVHGLRQRKGSLFFVGQHLDSTTWIGSRSAGIPVEKAIDLIYGTRCRGGDALASPRETRERAASVDGKRAAGHRSNKRPMIEPASCATSRS